MVNKVYCVENGSILDWLTYRKWYRIKENWSPTRRSKAGIAWPINKAHVHGESNTMKYCGMQSGNVAKGAAANNQDTAQNWKFGR